jgi:TonB-dependent receptor
MQQKLYSLIVLIFISISSSAQKAKIIGKVVNSKTGDALIGATVTLTGTTKSVQSDQKGTYSLAGLDAGTYSITVTYVSYNANTIANITVKTGEVVTQDVVMEPAADMSGVVVKSSGGGSNRPKATVSALLLAQKNSASVSDGISAETIKRTPDRNTGDILKRVSGASLQDDKFAIIRGLNDRYNTASLNGAPLPSSESDRKAFAFDVFPANMLDNLVIYKTATPDMSGEFAGGQIVINTKGIPSENFQSFTYGMGFNTQSTFKPRKLYEGGQFDYLGIDDTRKLQTPFPSIEAFKNMSENERLVYARSFKTNNWGYTNRTALPNTSLQYVLGRNYMRNNKDFFGMLFSVSYNKTLTQNQGERIFYAPEYNNAAQRVYEEEFNSVQTLFGTIANFSFKINNNHNLSFKNMYSINADDRVITRDGINDVINEPNNYFKSYALWFTSNKIYSTQLIGEHYLPTSKVKINWVGSYSNIQRDIPALRRMAFDSVAGDPGYNAKLAATSPVDNDNTAGLIFYATNRETMKNFRADFSRSLTILKKVQSNFKAGFFIQNREREFNPRLLAFSSYNSSNFNQNILYNNPSEIFNKKNMGSLAGGKTGLNLKDITEIRDLYTAGTDLISYYGMADQRFGNWLRLIYGVRVEDFTQRLNASLNQFTPVVINTRKVDVLPSLNVVFSLDKKQNIRASYSKTLNRPEFRELAPFLFRDYSIRYSIFGDTSLRRATIDNFDFRYEWYPGKAQLISASVFYKKFIDPIELISTNQDRTLAFRNTPKANLRGVELEIRTLVGSLFQAPASSIWNKLTVFGNLSLIQSEVTLQVNDTNNYYYRRTRVMQGQSPYVINGGVTYQDEEKNLTTTLSVNRYGQRVFLASNGDATQDGLLFEPNLWENGRTQIDFQIAKSFPEKKLELKLNVKDILAQQLIFFEDNDNNKRFDKGIDPERSSLQFGRVITASLTYTF